MVFLNKKTAGVAVCYTYIFDNTKPNATPVGLQTKNDGRLYLLS